MIRNFIIIGKFLQEANWQIRKWDKEVEELRVFWKLLIWLLNCKSKDYIKAVKSNGEIFWIEITKYANPSDELERWKTRNSL